MQGCMSSMFGENTGELSAGLKQLKEEHPPLLAMLEDLLETCRLVETEDGKAKVFQELYQKVQAFLAELEPHSEREEGVLFTMMEKYIGRTSGPIAVMEYEHDQAKGYIAKFLNDAAKDEAYTDEQMIQLSALIKNAYYTLVDHFAKEENVLFPMAQNMLSEEEKQELYEKIKK